MRSLPLAIAALSLSYCSAASPKTPVATKQGALDAKGGRQPSRRARAGAPTRSTRSVASVECQILEAAIDYVWKRYKFDRDPGVAIRSESMGLSNRDAQSDIQKKLAKASKSVIRLEACVNIKGKYRLIDSAIYDELVRTQDSERIGRLHRFVHGFWVSAPAILEEGQVAAVRVGVMSFGDFRWGAILQLRKTSEGWRFEKNLMVSIP